METEKLYYADPYLTDFTATVLDCEPGKNGYLVTSGPHGLLPGGGRPAGGSRHSGRRCRHRRPRKGRRDSPHLRQPLWKLGTPWRAPSTGTGGSTTCSSTPESISYPACICSALSLRQCGLPPGGGHRDHRLQRRHLTGRSVAELEAARPTSYICAGPPHRHLRSLTGERSWRPWTTGAKRRWTGEVRIVAFPGRGLLRLLRHPRCLRRGQVGLVKFLSVPEVPGGRAD